MNAWKKLRVSEKPFSEMSISELKEKLNALGIATRVRKKEKLTELIKINT